MKKNYPVIRELPFDRLIRELQPRLEFHVQKHRGKILGFDDDDIYQELIIELWKKLPKIPADMIHVDYRFTRFIETIFERRISRLYRDQFVQRRPGAHRDAYTASHLVESMERIIDP